MKKLIWIVVMVASLIGAAAVVAQETAPTVSEVQRLRLQNAAQAVEIAELKYRQASQDLQRLIQALQVEGYTLDLNTLTYVPKEPRTTQ